MSIYASILAGGSGTRLWPLSTKAIPKQFLTLAGDRTMIQATIDRLGTLASIDHTYVVTFANYADLVHEQLPTLPVGHILAEPSGRGTAASIGLAATFIAAQDPNAVMGSFTADHIITDVAAFQRALAFAEEVARTGYLVTLGIQPTYPETGYGYIQAGDAISQGPEDLMAYRTKRFVEKPRGEVAEAYLQSGDYAWNAGIFVWRVDRILAEIREHVPTIGKVLDMIAQGIKEGRAQEAISEAWPQLTANVTIDVGVLEQSSSIAVIPCEIGWNDIGNWAQMATLHSADSASNRASGPGRHIAIETRDTFVYTTADRVIATAGVEGLVIVDTGDAVLVLHKDHVQRVKEITEQLHS